MRSNLLTKGIFGLYLLLLTWGILLKFETNLSYLPFFYGSRVLNLLPFSEPLIVNGELVFAEMVFNLLAFVPFGVSLPLVRQGWSFWKVIGLGFSLSLLYEILQFILTIGMADVTDLLMNTLGVVIGVGILAFMRKLFPTKVRLIVNLLGLILGGLVIFILAVLFILSA